MKKNTIHRRIWAWKITPVNKYVSLTRHIRRHQAYRNQENNAPLPQLQDSPDLPVSPLHDDNALSLTVPASSSDHVSRRRSRRLNELTPVTAATATATSTATTAASATPIFLTAPSDPIPLRFQAASYMSTTMPSINRNAFTSWHQDFSRHITTNLAHDEEFSLTAPNARTGASWMFKALHALANDRDVPLPDDNDTPSAEVTIKNCTMRSLHSLFTMIQMYVVS